MDKINYSMGAKNPKKEITINVKPKHIFLGFIVLCVSIMLILQMLIWLDVIEPEQEVLCNDGSKDIVEESKFYYCGEHYTTLKDKVSDDTYNLMEAKINGD